MNMRYDVGQYRTLFNRESRQHGHQHHESSPSQTGNRPEQRGFGDSPHGAGHSSMFFHVGNRETVLFGFWITDSTLTLVLSCLIVFVIAVSYEALKCYREWLNKCGKKRQEGGSDRRSVGSTSRMNVRSSASSQMMASPMVMESYPLPLTLVATEATPPPPARLPWLTCIHCYQTVLHMLQVTISFLLMLIFMTFNVWLCLAVVLGAGFGYFIFFARSENVSDHCN